MIRMARSSASRVSSAKHMHRNKRLMYTAAAAAFSTLPGGSAFSVHPRLVSRPRTTRTIRVPSNFVEQPPCYSYHSTARSFSSRKDDSSGFLGTVKNAAKSVAKSILPSSWFQTEKEKQQAIERKRYRDEVKGGIKELLKDAPLPIRMMGSMVGPLMSSAMSTMAESLAEQQKTVDDYLSQARLLLQSDDTVERVLGDPIQVGNPFSQSSSTSSINGQTTTRVEIGFPVSGSRGSGTAQLSATQEGIQRLVLQAQGRQINVSLTSSPGTRNKFAGRKDDDDDVIEAEIIEKDTRR